MRATSRVLLLLALVAAWAVACPATAEAHGGRIKPPPEPPDPNHKPGTPGRVPVDPVPLPHPPRLPTDPPPSLDPTTPQGPSPEDPTVGGRGRPTTAGSSRPTGAARRGGRSSAATAESHWQMWWALNRWSYLPQRLRGGAAADAVVTPSGEGRSALDRAALERKRRDLVRRQQIVPFLLEVLDPSTRVRDEVRAAALLALAKLSHDEATLALLLRYAENARASRLVRESAALAVGLCRRDAPLATPAGTRLDRVRERLLGLVDDTQAPRRTRAFAALSIGLLGDQPFGSAFTKDGRVVVRALWERLQVRPQGREMPVALLTALGMQPAAGVPGEVREGLQRIVAGRRHAGRSWDASERSHALTALLAQQPEGCPPSLLRTLASRRTPAPVLRAGLIALAARSEALDAEAREQALEVIERGLDAARDNLSRGLGWIAAGRVLGGELREGTATLLTRSTLAEELLATARRGSHSVRGFAALGLALALRDARAAGAHALGWRVKALEALAGGLEERGDPSVRAAFAVGLGLLGEEAQEAGAALAGVLTERGADPALRGHAALALAQVDPQSAHARKALRTALLDKRSVALRSQAALALSFLGGRAETTLLLRELQQARSQWVQMQVAAALGQLGDVAAVPEVLAIARDRQRGEETRALAIASLGLLGDPLERPSLLRLTRDANYPALTDALHEAFSIL